MRRRGAAVGSLVAAGLVLGALVGGLWWGGSSDASTSVDGSLVAAGGSSTSGSDPASTSSASSTSSSTTVLEPAPPAADPGPAPELPRLTAEEIVALVEVLSQADGTWPAAEDLPILGDPAADARIRSAAEARGYRRRPVLVVPPADLDGFLLHPAVPIPLSELLGSIRSAGLPVEVRSTLRTTEQQRMIFERELVEEGRARIGRPYSVEEVAAGAADDAIESVLRFHSIPGYSRHHSGLAVDLSTGSGPLATFTGTATEVWLRDDGYRNAMRHGFLPSYPVGAGGFGPQPESWEYVYVGVGGIRCAVLHIEVADPEAPRACPLLEG